MAARLLHEPVRLAGASLLRLQSDERLAALAHEGHEAAFTAIVQRHRGALVRYCAAIVGPARADDAVQQALINAHEALQRTDEVRHVRSWLYRIAHNASLNVLRAVRDESPLDAAYASLDRPDERLEHSERLREALAVLRQLPENQRAAIVLRELEGRSHDEIAAALGVTPGAARQALMRARTTLRQAATAITPYPLAARFAEMIAGSGGSQLVDAVAGAGAAATLAKLGAGIAATGALVGGGVAVTGGGPDHPTTPAAATAAEQPRVSGARQAAPGRISGAQLVSGGSGAPGASTSLTSGASSGRGSAGDGQGKSSQPDDRGGRTGGGGSDDGDDDDNGRRDTVAAPAPKTSGRREDDDNAGDDSSGSGSGKSGGDSGKRRPETDDHAAGSDPSHSGSGDTPEADKPEAGTPEADKPEGDKTETPAAGETSSGSHGGGDKPEDLVPGGATVTTPVQPPADTRSGGHGPD